MSRTAGNSLHIYFAFQLQKKSFKIKSEGYILTERAVDCFVKTKQTKNQNRFFKKEKKQRNPKKATTTKTKLKFYKEP